METHPNESFTTLMSSCVCGFVLPTKRNLLSDLCQSHVFFNMSLYSAAVVTTLQPNIITFSQLRIH